MRGSDAPEVSPAIFHLVQHLAARKLDPFPSCSDALIGLLEGAAHQLQFLLRFPAEIETYRLESLLRFLAYRLKSLLHFLAEVVTCQLESLLRFLAYRLKSLLHFLAEIVTCRL